MTDAQISQLLICQTSHKLIQCLVPGDHLREIKGLRLLSLGHNLGVESHSRLNSGSIQLDDQRSGDLLRLSLIAVGCSLRLHILEFPARTDMFYLLGYRILINTAHMGISGAVAHTDDIFSGLKDIGGSLLGEGCHGGGVKGNGYLGLLSRCQFLRLGKSLQFLIGLIQLAGRSGHVHLHNLLAGEIAGILYGSGHGYLFLIRRHALSLYLKGCVAEAVSEGIYRRLIYRVKIAVSHVDSFFVVGIVGVSESFRGGIARDGRPGGGQLSGGIALAEQDICQHISGRCSQLAQKQNILNRADRGEIHHASHIQHQDKFVVLLIQCQNISLLGLCQVDISGHRRAVSSLAGISRQHIDGRLSLALQRNIVSRLRHNLAHAVPDGVDPGGLRLGLQSLKELCLLLCQHGSVGVQPCLTGNLKAGVLQSFLHRDKVTYVHIAGSGSSLNGVSRPVSEERDLSGGCQRKIPVALQQHRTLRSHIPHRGNVLLFKVLYITVRNTYHFFFSSFSSGHSRMNI